MNLLGQKNIFKVFTLVLAVSLLLPSATKFMHIFEDHHHEVCYGEPDAHFHTLDLDCEFYKFQLNIPFTIPENLTDLVVFPEIKTIIPSEYSFLSEYQCLHFSLRGPPLDDLI